MAGRIVELFGYAPTDHSDAARQARATLHCPFIKDVCQKALSDGTVSGACTLKPARGAPVICCPYRLYSDIDWEAGRGMKAFAGFEKVGGNSHRATLKMRFTDSAAKICRATAAATGGGKALPIWR